jgi:flagellar biogenesis protein FliO
MPLSNLSNTLHTPGLHDSGGHALGVASSQTLLWKYMATVGVYSAVVIGLLVAFLWLLKTKPGFTAKLKTLFGLKAPAPAPQPKLNIEEAMVVEEGKKLMIIQCEGERFLVASGAEGIQFLTKLNDGQGMMPAIHVQMEAPESQTYEDGSGIRGKAITPTDSGVSVPTPPVFKGLQPAFMNAVKDLIPKAETTVSRSNFGEQTPPPFGPKQRTRR